MPTKLFEKSLINRALFNAQELGRELRCLAMQHPKLAEIEGGDRLLDRLAYLGEVIYAAAANKRVMPHCEEECIAAMLFEASRSLSVTGLPAGALNWETGNTENINDKFGWFAKGRAE